MSATFSCRTLLQLAGSGAISLAAGASHAATRLMRADFLWGASTAGYRVEGGTVSSDSWVLEHIEPKSFAAPSGNACDSYHRWREDMAMRTPTGSERASIHLHSAFQDRSHAYPRPSLVPRFERHIGVRRGASHCRPYIK
jgi:hypothetical protein